MAFFKMRTQNVKVTFSPFSSDSMSQIGSVVLNHIKSRIASAQDVTDSRAKPLKENYAEEKRKGRYVALGGPRKYRGLPYRDWTLRGRTMQSLQVKFASQDRVTIGPTSQETAMIVAVRNRVDKMWGLSPSDNEALVAVTLHMLRTAQVVRVEHERKAA